MNKPSDEQKIVVDLLENYNIVVDSVAGSGKTTTCQFIAQKYNKVKILLITYNRQLRKETESTFKKLGVDNVDVHTYHSFCFNNYQRTIDDNGIEQITKDDIQSDCLLSYKIIIVDEAQDMTPRYYKLIQKICQDQIGDFKLCIMGDKKQCIYQFNESDHRFLVYAPELFKSVNKFEWRETKLSTSYRLPKMHSQFLNNCVLNENRIQSTKEGQPPKYLIFSPQREFQEFDAIYKRVSQTKKTKEEILSQIKTEYESPNKEGLFKLILGFLNNYSPEDIFLIAPSVKGDSKSDLKRLVNRLSNINIPICKIDSDDDQKPSDQVQQQKIALLSYHQSKGLQRKVVIVFNFDSSYHTYYNRDQEVDTRACSNEHYVALTRSQEQLVIVHFENQSYLPFIKEGSLQQNTEQLGTDLIPPRNSTHQQQITTTPKQLTKHLPCGIVQQALQKLSSNNDNISNSQEDKSKIQEITEQKFIALNFNSEITSEIKIYESTRMINENAILGYLDIISNQECFLNNELEEFYEKNPTREKDCDALQIKLNTFNQEEYEKIQSLQKKYNKYSHILQEKNKIIKEVNQINHIENLLYLSNYLGSQNEYNFRLNQIKEYNWIKSEQFLELGRNLIEILGDGHQFKPKVDYNHTMPDGSNVLINAQMSLFKDNEIWEIKLVEKILDEHKLQLAIIKYGFLKLNKSHYIENVSQKCKELRKELDSLFKVSLSDYQIDKVNKQIQKPEKMSSRQQRIAKFKDNQENEERKAEDRKKKIALLDKIEEFDSYLEKLQLDIFFTFKLLSIKTYEIYEDTSDFEQLEKMLEVLIQYKYGGKQNQKYDKDFIQDMQNNYCFQKIDQ